MSNNNEKKNTDYTFEIVAGIFLVLTIVFIVIKEVKGFLGKMIDCNHE